MIWLLLSKQFIIKFNTVSGRFFWIKIMTICCVVTGKIHSIRGAYHELSGYDSPIKMTKYLTRSISIPSHKLELKLSMLRHVSILHT